MKMKREEVKEGRWGNKLIYSRRDKVGEGFGKRKVGIKVKIKEYIYGKEKIDKDGFRYKESKVNILEGVIIIIVRRINKNYYDYWYKVEIGENKYNWVSYVEIV